MKLDNLVAAVHKSVIAAAEQMQKHNLELLDIYFEKADNSNVRQHLRDTLSSSISGETPQKSEELVENVMASISPEFLSAYSNHKDHLVPKTVVIQYPRITANGPVVHDVIVPLIAIVPLSMTEVSSVILKTDLEVNVVNDELEISFPTNKADESKQANILNLEMTIEKSVTPGGLQKLIEGYEKALRAQIPG